MLNQVLKVSASHANASSQTFIPIINSFINNSTLQPCHDSTRSCFTFQKY